MRRSARPGRHQSENTRTHDLTPSTHLPFLGVAAGRHGRAIAVSCTCPKWRTCCRSSRSSNHMGNLATRPQTRNTAEMLGQKYPSDGVFDRFRHWPTPGARRSCLRRSLSRPPVSDCERRAGRRRSGHSDRRSASRGRAPPRFRPRSPRLAMRERHSSCRGVSGEGTGSRSAKCASVARRVRLVRGDLFQRSPPPTCLGRFDCGTRHSSWLAILAEPAGAHGRGQPGVYASPDCDATAEAPFRHRPSDAFADQLCCEADPSGPQDGLCPIDRSSETLDLAAT